MLFDITGNYNQGPLFTPPQPGTWVTTSGPDPSGPGPNTTGWPAGTVKTPVDPKGVATIIPPLKGTPDAVDVCLTMIPGYAVMPYIGTDNAANILGNDADPGWKLYGSHDPDVVYPYYTGDVYHPISIPCTHPAAGSHMTIGIWVYCNEAVPTAAHLRISSVEMTLAASDADSQQYVFRYIFNYTWPDSDHGVNHDLRVDFKLDGSHYQIVAAQIPLKNHGGFLMKRFTGVKYQFTPPADEGGTWPAFPLTEFKQGVQTSQRLIHLVNKNGGFSTPIYFSGNFYYTGTGVSVGYPASNDYTKIQAFKAAPPVVDGLQNVLLVYQGGSVVGGGFGYVVYVESS